MTVDPAGSQWWFKLLPLEKFSAARTVNTDVECVFSDYIKKKQKEWEKKEEKLEPWRVVKSSRPGHSGAHQTIIKGGNYFYSI